MNLRLSYLLLTVWVFCIGTKSYAQRAIHLLEPMFTYDYALKYYGNSHIRDLVLSNFFTKLYFLDNFMASTDVTSITTNIEPKRRDIPDYFEIPFKRRKELKKTL